MFDVNPITSTRPTDCGATCLQMLLAYYSVDVPLEQLIEECDTRIVGCTGKDIIVAGRMHGLDMKAYQMDAAEVARADRPSIIWWKYSHWCVCCGMDEDGKVVICNPDKGRYRMSEGMFKSFYTGVALTNSEPQDLPA